MFYYLIIHQYVIVTIQCLGEGHLILLEIVAKSCKDPALYYTWAHIMGHRNRSIGGHVFSNLDVN